MAWKKHWNEPNDTAAAEIETCPACTSAVDAQAAICTQCGADLDYYRQQKVAAETGQPNGSASE